MPFTDPRVVRAPDFPPGLDWLQAGDVAAHSAADDVAARGLAALRGRVALVDLWTYGCINCLHVLPELRALEARFPDVLAVVGIHSGKFAAERQTPRLARALDRLGVAHPVLNDRQFRAWRAWAARGWPTLALVDPRGYVVGQVMGERTADALAPVIARVVEEARMDGSLAPGPWPHLRPAPVRDAALRYPGKVAVSAPDVAGVRRLAIADTGHDRVVVGALDATGTRLTVERVIARLDGSAVAHAHDAEHHAAHHAAHHTAQGAVHAPPRDASLVAPQGLAFGDGAHAGTLFVADAGRHRVCAVDLATGAARVLAGTGARVRTAAERAAGAMASPWDLAHVVLGGRPTLLVAMAGTHEVWALDPDTGAARVVAGGRGEGLVDGPAPEALLAQPMGLCAGGTSRTAWIADAESSAVRALALRTTDPGAARDEAATSPRLGHGAAAVRTLVGTGLFDFGDADGVGDDVRLQHPQGLAWHAPSARLLVADTYNDALRWLDPATRAVTTWCRGVAEPGGVAVAGDTVWVAETGAHRVRVLDVARGGETELALAW